MLSLHNRLGRFSIVRIFLVGKLICAISINQQTIYRGGNLLYKCASLIFITTIDFSNLFSIFLEKNPQSYHALHWSSLGDEVFSHSASSSRNNRLSYTEYHFNASYHFVLRRVFIKYIRIPIHINYKWVWTVSDTLS